MRRVPYIRVNKQGITYICPKCKKDIQRDLYILYDYCPTCGHPINRTSKSMFEVYKLIDKEMLSYFINKIEEE